jgi:hypothetical protein
MTKWVTDLRSSPNYLRGILAAVKVRLCAASDFTKCILMPGNCTGYSQQIYLRLADEPDLVQKVQAAQEGELFRFPSSYISHKHYADRISPHSLIPR